ncbi:MAG TPA: protein-export chaperone SecB [Paracoccaceae bacterium]|nr:protein-export chaperone SecB [Paracoccaceae bacterium]
MTDETTTENKEAAAGAAQQPQTPPQMKMLGQFTRDLSFENISLMKGEPLEGQPTYTVGLNLDAKPIAENVYDLIMKIKVDGKTEKQQIFLLELDYVGRFQVSNIQPEHVHPFLMVECARILFPFARRIVTEVARDGGHGGMNLDAVDFVALYRQELTRRVQQQAAAAAQENKIS